MKYIKKNQCDLHRINVTCFAIFILFFTPKCNHSKSSLTYDQINNCIAFVSYPTMSNSNYAVSKKEIYIINVENKAEPIRITYNTSWEEEPIWLQQGTEIVFRRCIGSVGSPKSKWYLYKRALLSNQESRLIEINMGMKCVGIKNLFILDYPLGIYLFDSARSGLKKILPIDTCDNIKACAQWNVELWDFAVDKSEKYFVIIFADRERIKDKILAKDEYKCYELAIVNIDGTNFQVLTNDTFPDFAPAISPDGKFIAFESVRERNRDIYIMEIESRKLTRLTEHPADDYSPTWSPDGKRVAFISDRDGHSHIYVINADGTGLFQLTKGEFEVWPGISWSPR
ncbi:MAG: hypothetical protein ABIL66_04775 [candidate division WOR-3 bacterium]